MEPFFFQKKRIHVSLYIHTCAIPNANAVFPVPGAPANSNARPAILRERIKSTTTPHASLAFSCPTNPDPMGNAIPVFGFNPNPLICV